MLAARAARPGPRAGRGRLAGDARGRPAGPREQSTTPSYPVRSRPDPCPRPVRGRPLGRPPVPGPLKRGRRWAAMIRATSGPISNCAPAGRSGRLGDPAAFPPLRRRVEGRRHQVTAADRQAEDVIRAMLRRERPTTACSARIREEPGAPAPRGDGSSTRSTGPPPSPSACRASAPSSRCSTAPSRSSAIHQPATGQTTYAATRPRLLVRSRRRRARARPRRPRRAAGLGVCLHDRTPFRDVQSTVADPLPPRPLIRSAGAFDLSATASSMPSSAASPTRDRHLDEPLGHRGAGALRRGGRRHRLRARRRSRSRHLRRSILSSPNSALHDEVLRLLAPTAGQ